MKKTLYMLAALVFSLVAVSCDKVLEETPKGQVLSNSAFTHAGDLEGSLQVLRHKVSRGTFYITQFIQSTMGSLNLIHP